MIKVKINKNLETFLLFGCTACSHSKNILLFYIFFMIIEVGIYFFSLKLKLIVEKKNIFFFYI